jgi:outer membrane protein assembly factor BamA
MPAGGWMAKLAGLGIFLLLTLQWMGSAAQAQQSPKPTIERIDIRGNRRIPEETIRFYIQSRPGDVFDESRLEFDFRALYRSNFFEDMEV